MMRLRTFGTLLLLLISTVACLPEEEPPLPTVVIPTRDGAEPADSATSDTPTEPAPTTELEPAATQETIAATPTLAATPTPEPTPTVSVPITSLPIQPVTAPPLPAAGRDLLFIADGALKKWNHRNGQLEILVSGPSPTSRVTADGQQLDSFVGDVTDFVVSPDGKRALVGRRTGTILKTQTVLTQNDSEEEVEIEFPIHEIVFLDTVSGDQWTIVSQVANLQSMDLSPNAAHATFVASSTNGDLSLDADDRAPSQMFYVVTGGGSSPSGLRAVAACVEFCSAPVWHIESNLVVWADREALKLFNIAGSEAEILLPNRLEPPMETAVYMPRTWARNGRFLLVTVGQFEGSRRAVFDVPTRTIIDIPETLSYIEPFPIELMWMPDDRLFILRTGDALTPTAELWRVLIDDVTIVKEESLLLTNNNVGAMGQMYLDDGRFAYALISDNPDIAGLYHLTSLSQQPEKVNAIPASPIDLTRTISEVTWSSFSFGAIVVHNGIPYYGLVDAGVLYDMSAVFGADAHSFHWQPDIPLP